jgi:hypothetical protein
VEFLRPDGMGEVCTRLSRYYALYCKDDPQKTEVAIGESIAGILDKVQARTGRPSIDFQFREISESEFESLTSAEG